MSRIGMFTRYKFIKKLYPNYLVIIKYNDKFKSFRMDCLLLNYLIDNNKIKKLNKLKINYVILNNLDIIEINEYLNNNYYRYIKVSYLNMVLIKIKDRLKQG